MTRKEQLDQEYRAKRMAGGFDAPTAAETAASRRGPVKRSWKGAIIFSLLVIGGLAAVCWRTQFLEGITTSQKHVTERVVATDRPAAMGATALTSPAAPASEEEVAKTVKSHLGFFLPTKAELDQLYEYVAKSPHVQENTQYREIVDSVVFSYSNNCAIVNAFAAWRKLDPKNSEKISRVIVFYGGAAVFCRLSALSVAAGLAGDKDAVKRFIGALGARDCDLVNFDGVRRIVREARLEQALANDQVREKAKSVAAGMIIGILAHEAGHQALGHCDNVARDRNQEVSRNQERQADSFQHCVISASPFGEYVFAGSLLWHYALASQEEGEQESTHPLSKERLENLVRANPEKAAEMGIVLK